MSEDGFGTQPQDHGPEGDSALAGEYVLGVLSASERRSVERRIATDAQFAALVANWQTDLAALDVHYASQNVPPRLERQIEARLFGQPEGKTSGLWASLVFWRGFALAAVVAVAVLASLLSGLVPMDGNGGAGAGAALVADLSGENTPLGLVAHFDPATGSLAIVPAALGGDKSHSLELWAIPADGVPRSLGLVPHDGGMLSVGRERIGDLMEGVTLAVSLEPEGGSPTGAPTGPVLVAGQLGRAL